MESLINAVEKAAGSTVVSLSHNWPYLLASIVIAAALKVFVDADKISAFLTRFRSAGIIAATLAAVCTPLCSCGTTAIVLGMMASTMPWAPIVAFMVSSPLSSPEGVVYSAGLFGWPFAISFFIASIFLGLGSGLVAAFLENRGFLKGQARFASIAPGIDQAQTVGASSCGCGPAHADAVETESCGCSSRSAEPLPSAASHEASGRLLSVGREVWTISKKLIPMFLGFAFLGFLINGLVPATWIPALFGQGKSYGVALAATIGLPLYINGEASLPMARALMESGMSQGSIMAFLVAGSGTSVGAIAGALTIARWKVVFLVVAALWIGAMLAGYGFDLALAAGLA
jgi:uncharacterized protein